MQISVYKFSPIILPLVGLFYSLATRYIFEHISDRYHSVFWFCDASILVILLFMCGRLIKSSHRDSQVDFLTGLGNRAQFHEKLQANLPKGQLSLVMIDVDNFKVANDTYGHQRGDDILKELAFIFRKNTRATDCITRWGGDEFALILPAIDAEAAQKIAERIREMVEVICCEYQVTVSLGVVHIEAETDINKVELLADQALYEAKRIKNSVIMKCDVRGCSVISQKKY